MSATTDEPTCGKLYRLDHAPRIEGGEPACRSCGSSTSERLSGPKNEPVTFCTLPCTYLRGHNAACGSARERFEAIAQLLAKILLKDQTRSVDHVRVLQLLNTTCYRVLPLDDSTAELVCSLREVARVV